MVPERVERNIQRGRLWSCIQRQLESSSARAARHIAHTSHQNGWERPDTPIKCSPCRQNTHTVDSSAHSEESYHSEVKGYSNNGSIPSTRAETQRQDTHTHTQSPCCSPGLWFEDIDNKPAAHPEWRQVERRWERSQKTQLEYSTPNQAAKLY